MLCRMAESTTFEREAERRKDLYVPLSPWPDVCMGLREEDSHMGFQQVTWVSYSGNTKEPNPWPANSQDLQKMLFKHRLSWLDLTYIFSVISRSV